MNPTLTAGGHRRGAGLALGVTLLPVCAPSAGTDALTLESLAEDPRQRYYLYLPTSARPGAPVLVAIHGISRNAEEQALAFAAQARSRGFVVVAPIFDPDRFPDYQRLGASGRGPRPDHSLQRVLAALAERSLADTDRVYLFGYSGGAQFAHRFAMAHPDRVAGVALGAAGWYTLPDPSADFPYGTRTVAGLADLAFDADVFLRVPTCVLVGELDVVRDPALRRSRRLDRDQGPNRLERARRWVEALRARAEQRGTALAPTLEVLPRSDHSFRRCARRGGLVERVVECLLGRRAEAGAPAPAPRPRPALRVLAPRPARMASPGHGLE